MKLNNNSNNVKKSIFVMKQYELWEYLVSIIKNSKHEITSNGFSEESMNNLKILNDWMEILKIYKEMRKIISMSFKTSEFVSPEELEHNEGIIDKKCRLTLIKCLTKVNNMLNYEFDIFKKIKLLCIQIKRIEERIWSPVHIRRDRDKHMNCIDWNWIRWTKKTGYRNHDIIFNNRCLSH